MGTRSEQWPQLAEELAHAVMAHDAVLDGEIVCLDDRGRSHFKNLLFRREWPFFYAFDLLWVDGEDLRELLFPMGKLQSYWTAQNLSALPDPAIEIIAARAGSRPSPLTLVATFQMGGAINRVHPSDTAYAERSALWMSSIDGNWADPADNERMVAWVRESFNQIAPFSSGTTYTNFTGQADEAAVALTASAYGPNMPRLATIKARYDPGNFFRLNPNIAPATVAGA